MVRSFDATPVDPEWLRACCAEALRAPTAGNARGVRMHVVGPDDVAGYLEVATDAHWRASSRRFAGLSRAGGAVLVTSRPADYSRRYAEPDKVSSGLDDLEAWPLPYWHTDAAMATMALLLLLEEARWSATLWGNFRREDEVRTWAHLEDEVLFASVLVGRSDGQDHPSPSLARDAATRAERVGLVRP
jgi:nitroreductase